MCFATFSLFMLLVMVMFWFVYVGSRTNAVFFVFLFADDAPVFVKAYTCLDTCHNLTHRFW